MVQIDMEMPNGCADCPFATHCNLCEGYNDYCILSPEHEFAMETDKKGRMGDTLYHETRPDWCPLTEVKENAAT